MAWDRSKRLCSQCHEASAAEVEGCSCEGFRQRNTATLRAGGGNNLQANNESTDQLGSTTVSPYCDLDTTQMHVTRHGQVVQGD